MATDPEINAFLSAEAGLPCFSAVAVVTQVIMREWGESVAAVIFYGSGLREESTCDKVLDFYVIVDSYRSAHRSIAAAWFNWLLPPNVYYHECSSQGQMIRAKYGVYSRRQLRRKTAPTCFNATLWARLSQPVRVVYFRDDQVRNEIIEAIASSVTKMIALTLPLLGRHFSTQDLWLRAFTETYRAELRSESPDRGRALYSHDGERYRNLTHLLLKHRPQFSGYGQKNDVITRTDRAPAGSYWSARLAWGLRRWQGKTLSFLRLVKAAFTFQGGLDYIVWKIERHSGVHFTVSPWQRRHPVVAGVLMFWRAWRQRAFR